MIEFTQDVEAVAVETSNESAFAELAELQLAVVGGGVGTVLWG
jgi:hypothetical protein